MKRIIVVRFTKAEADGLLTAACAGIEDLIDAQTDEADEDQENANLALRKLGQAMAAAWPEGREASP